MSNQYGPWATLIDAGGNPQLSAFWQRRLAMLVPASRTSPVLSQRNLLYLVAVGILTCILPTFFFAAAAAEDKKPAESGNTVVDDKSDQETKPANGPTASDQKFYGSVGIFTTPSVHELSSYLSIPCFIYNQLSYESTRKELKISPDQEKKLREISDSYMKLQRDSKNNLQKEIQTLAPQEQITKQRELNDKLAAERKKIRKQIEELLATEQWTAARSTSVGLSAAGRLIQDERFREKIGVSEEQNKELSQRLVEDAKQDGKLKDKYKQQGQSMQDNGDKTLAVLTPQQWEKLEQLVGDKETGIDSIIHNGMRASTYPGPELQELSYPDLRNELSLSEEQQTKLDEIVAKSQAQAQELSKTVDKHNSFLPDKGQAAQQDEFPQKLSEMRKHDHEEIKAVLSAQQWAAFKKSALRHEFLIMMNMSGLFDFGKEQPGILDILDATQEQRAEFRKLAGEYGGLMRQHYRETGEIILKILNPQQQEKLFDELDRLINPDPGPPADAAKPSGETQTLTKRGVVTMTITGNDSTESAKKTSAEAAKSSDEKQSLSKSGTGTFTIGIKSDAGMVIVGNSSAVAPAIESTPDDRTPYYVSYEYILPAYRAIAGPKIRKQMELSPQQEKKLREISAAFMAEQVKFDQKVMNAPPKEREAMSEEFKQKFEELRTNIRKQIEEVVTYQQLDAYKKIIFPDMAFALLQDPQVLKIIDITPDQKAKLQQLRKELGQRLEQDLRERTDRILALLSREQTEKLRTEAEQIYREFHEPSVEETGSYTRAIETGTLTLAANYSYHASDELAVTNNEHGADYFILPIYENLGLAAVRKTLGLSADQEKQLKEIAVNYRAEMKKQGQELQKLAPEEQKRKQRELRQESIRLINEIHQQIEALLTPDQLASLKDDLFHLCAFYTLQAYLVKEKLALSDQQKATLNIIVQDWGKKARRVELESELDVLTPGQHEKLREELNRRGW